MDTTGHMGGLLNFRSPAIQQIALHFTYDHLPDHLQQYSMHCASLAEAMIRSLPDSDELTIGLRKLLEAKDCFIRAAVDQ